MMMTQLLSVIQFSRIVIYIQTYTYYMYCSFISRESSCLLQSAKLASLITYKLEHHKAPNVLFVRLSFIKLDLWEVCDWTKRCRTLCSNLCQVFTRKKWKEEGPFMNKVSFTLDRFPYMVTPSSFSIRK